MAYRVTRKIRLLSYAFIVLLVGGLTGWVTGPDGSGVQKVHADDPTATGGSTGDGPASGCPAPADGCCDGA